jgi:hypothetical protein
MQKIYVAMLRWTDKEGSLASRAIRVGSPAWREFCVNELPNMPDDVDITTLELDENAPTPQD